mmetsp:Transcript_19735/g.61839  ORF Transcript_19735/g.61839 Transcript_19735/m.61839 type:complete len:229 (+) Transcript_19735:1230-1916(+)
MPRWRRKSMTPIRMFLNDSNRLPPSLPPCATTFSKTATDCVCFSPSSSTSLPAASRARALRSARTRSYWTWFFIMRSVKKSTTPRQMKYMQMPRKSAKCACSTAMKTWLCDCAPQRPSLPNAMASKTLSEWHAKTMSARKPRTVISHLVWSRSWRTQCGCHSFHVKHVTKSRGWCAWWCSCGGASWAPVTCAIQPLVECSSPAQWMRWWCPISNMSVMHNSARTMRPS